MQQHMDMDLDAWSTWDQRAVETLVMIKGSREQSMFNAALASLPPVATRNRAVRSRACSPWTGTDVSSPAYGELSSSLSADGTENSIDQDHSSRQRPQRPHRAARAAAVREHVLMPVHKLAKKRAPSPTSSAALLTTLPLLSALFAPATPAASAPSRAPGAAFSAPASPMHMSPSNSCDQPAASSRSSSDWHDSSDFRLHPSGSKRASTPTSDDFSDPGTATFRLPKLPRTSILSAIASAAVEAHAAHCGLKAGQASHRRPLPLSRNNNMSMHHEHSRLSVTVNATGIAHLQPMHMAFPVQRMGVLRVGEAPA